MIACSLECGKQEALRPKATVVDLDSPLTHTEREGERERERKRRVLPKMELG